MKLDELKSKYDARGDATTVIRWEGIRRDERMGSDRMGGAKR